MNREICIIHKDEKGKVVDITYKSWHNREKWILINRNKIPASDRQFGYREVSNNQREEKEKKNGNIHS